MADKLGKLASNFDINKGSILLLFDESDAKIVRNWKNDAKDDREIEDEIDDPGALAA